MANPYGAINSAILRLAVKAMCDAAIAEGLGTNRQAIPKESKQEILQKVKKAITVVGQYAKEQTFLGTVWEAVQTILVAYCSLNDQPMEMRIELRLEVIQLLLKNDTVQHLSNILKKVIDEWLPTRFLSDGEPNEGYLHLACGIRNIFCHYSDTSSEFSQEVCKNAKIVKVMLKLARELQEEHFKGKLSEGMDELLLVNLTMAYNLSMHNDSGNVERLREYGVIGRIKPYLTSQDKRFRFISLMCLIYIEDDSESVNLSKNTEAVNFLIDQLKDALASEDRRANGFSSLEILKALAKFAVADENKSRLADLGILPILKEVLQTGKLSEKKSALHVMGQLAFNKKNADFVRKEMMALLQDISHDKTNRELQKNAKTVLWIIEKPRAQDRLTFTVIRRAVDVESSIAVQPSGSPSGEQKKGHIMISYSWINQTVVLQIRDFLAAQNFKVWIDREDLDGNLYEEISAAIESASIVLISVSEAYKDSPICRKEATYAIESGKKIIPIKVDSYKPDGWLGLLISGDIYHDFSGGFSEEAATRLLREIRRTCEPMRTSDSVDGAPVVRRHVVPRTQGSVGRQSSAEKSPEEVKQWLQANNIDWFQTISVDAEEIMYLAQMKKTAPESFHRYVIDNLKITALNKMTALAKALDALSIV